MTPEAVAWIEKQKPELVEAAEEYVATSGIYHKQSKAPKVSTSQLRNLLNIAQTERSLKVLINFLRYQIGRGNKGWQHTQSGKALEQFLNERVAKVCDQKQSELLGTSRRELEAKLGPLFLGYVMREYKYRCEGREKK